MRRKIAGAISCSAQIDEFSAEAVGNRLVKARLIDKTAIDHRLRDCFAVQLYFAQHVFRL